MLGGAIGGLLVFSYMIVMSVIDGSIFRHELTDIFEMLLATIAFGFFFGLIPSLIAALIITKFKIYFDSILKVIPLFIIGFFSGFVCASFMIISEGFFGALGGMSLYGFIGGLSAVVTGWFVLPKHK